MRNLRYYTSRTVEELRDNVGVHLDWYYRETGPPPPASLGGDFRESRIEAPALADLLQVERADLGSRDTDSALAVYQALRTLSPHQASMERMWVWLCHNDCPEYVRRRWLTSRPRSDDDATRQVLNHFFAKGNRALIRDNGISRLWWLGKVAHDAAPDRPRKFLEILLHRQDVRSALIERPSVSMNRAVLRTIFRVMEEYWDGDRALFKRETFRNWMIALNRRGGVVLLDGINHDGLYRLVREEAEASL